MDVKSIARQCQECGLYKNCITPFMPEDGSEDSKVLIVGEAPGATEDELGKPFVGESGQLLRNALMKIGLHDVVFTNVCRCRPENNATPTAKEIECCFPFTLEFMKKMKNLKLIIAVGDVALRAFTGKRGILQLSGKFLDYNDVKLMPIFHPASILYARDRRKLILFEEHLKRAKDYLANENYQSDFGQYYLIDNLEEWFQVIENIKASKIFAFDIETNSLKAFELGFEIKLISFCYEPKISYALDLTDWMYREESEVILTDLKAIMEDQNIAKIGHNIKFDSLCLRAVFGINVENIVWDTQIANYLLDPSPSSRLKELAYKVGCGGYEQGLPQDISNLPTKELWKYNAIDSDVTFRLYKKQIIEFNNYKKMFQFYKNIFIPMIKILETIEYHGILVDVEMLNKVWSRVRMKMNKVLDNIYEIESVKKYMKDKDVKFNPNSSKMVSEVLYSPEYENLPYKKLTAKGKQPSVKISYIEELASHNQLAKLLTDYSKFKSLDKIINDVYSNINVDNKIHTVLNLTSTISGRSSSEAPNLHSIPKGDKDIVGLRNVFISNPDYEFFEFDYNQWELRCAADISGDENLKKALASGDVHRQIASTILGISPEDVTEAQRRSIGKVMAFGTLYQMTPYGIMDRLKLIEKYKKLFPTTSYDVIRALAEKEAKDYIDKFFNKFPKLKAWIDQTIQQVTEYRYVENKLGMRRYFPKDVELTDHEIRSAVNIPIQSLAAHILYITLIGIDQFIRKHQLKSRVILEIHDSILMEIHKDEESIVPEILDIMKNFIYNYIEFSVPIEVNVKRGHTWGNMKEVSL